MDFDAIPPAVWGVGGAASMFTLLFYLLATGRMMTRQQHNEIVEPKDETISFQKETIDRLTTAVQNYAVSAHTGSTALRQISKAVEASKGGDD